MLPAVPVPPTPVVAAAWLAQAQADGRQSRRIDDRLTVEFAESTYDLETGELLFSGGVTARYDLTVVTSERLRLDTIRRRGRAEGNVTLTDPDASLESADLEFDWGAKTGRASAVAIRVGHVRLWAESLEVHPTEWVATNVRGTLSRAARPQHGLFARRVRIHPGRSGVAEGLFLELFGTRVGPWPSYTFSLDRRVSGFKLPSITERRGVGIGVGWDSQFLLTERSGLSGSAGIFPRQLPSYSIEYSMSPLNPLGGSTLLAPAGDLAERFLDSHLDFIGMRSSEEEDENLRVRRDSFAVGSYWNRSTTGRPRDGVGVSKPLEFVREFGRDVGGFAVVANARIQQIRPAPRADTIERGVLYFTAQAPVWRVAPNLGLRLRVDAFGTLSGDHDYAWLRGLASVTYRPWEPVSFSAGYSWGRGFGTPDFEFDPLVSERTWHLRGDLELGPYTVRYLAKYDVARQIWYDREYELALVVEGFEPFITVREFPSDTRIGIRFRTDDLFRKLQRREFRRD